MVKIVAFLGNIVDLQVDAIVNAANPELQAGAGVDAAIHKAAGPLLQLECNTLKGCKIGDAKITRGFKLKASYVIHAVGPSYEEDNSKFLLESCYIKSLELAQKSKARTIAFPAISTGIAGYPPEESAEIALSSIKRFIKKNPKVFTEIILVAFSKRIYDAYRKQF